MQAAITDILDALPVGNNASLETEIFGGVTAFIWTVLTGGVEPETKLHELLLKIVRYEA